MSEPQPIYQLVTALVLLLRENAILHCVIENEKQQLKILKNFNEEFFSLSLLEVNSSFVTSEVFDNSLLADFPQELTEVWGHAAV